MRQKRLLTLIIILFLGFIIMSPLTSYSQKKPKILFYQEFNRWGIVFEYPSSFIEFSSPELQQMKDKLSAELNSIIKEGRATCGQRSIDKITMFMSNDNLVGLGINKIKFLKAPTADCYLHERKISLSDVPPAGYEMKPGMNVKVFRLEKTKICGYDAITEDFEVLDRGERAYGLHILVGKTVYDILWIVLDKKKFREWEKPLLHIIGSIKIQQK